jgi:hypothetical protein
MSVPAMNFLSSPLRWTGGSFRRSRPFRYSRSKATMTIKAADGDVVAFPGVRPGSVMQREALAGHASGSLEDGALAEHAHLRCIGTRGNAIFRHGGLNQRPLSEVRSTDAAGAAAGRRWTAIDAMHRLRGPGSSDETRPS